MYLNKGQPSTESPHGPSDLTELFSKVGYKMTHVFTGNKMQHNDFANDWDFTYGSFLLIHVSPLVKWSFSVAKMHDLYQPYILTLSLRKYHPFSLSFPVGRSHPVCGVSFVRSRVFHRGFGGPARGVTG